jgi:Transposase DDE domain group 1
MPRRRHATEADLNARRCLGWLADLADYGWEDGLSRISRTVASSSRMLSGLPWNPSNSASRIVGFIVTTLTGTKGAIVRFLQPTGNGGTVDQGRQDRDWTRLSCHRFRANEVRLLLSVIAYNLGNLLRRLVLPATIQDWSLTSLQRRLLKTGGRLIRHARYFTLQLAESYLTGALFRQILQRIERLGWHPT